MNTEQTEKEDWLSAEDCPGALELII